MNFTDNLGFLDTLLQRCRVGPSDRAEPKTFFLPAGSQGSGYEEHNVGRAPYIHHEDDGTLFVIRRKHPHPTADARGTVSLSSLGSTTTLCSVCQGIQILGPECNFELLHLPLLKMERNAAEKCPLCKILARALQEPYSIDAPVTLPKWTREDENEKWRRYWGGINHIMPNAGVFVRRKWANITIGTFPHPQRPNEETYMTVILRHEGHDHGLCKVSIYTSKEELLQSTQISSEQAKNAIRERKFNRIRAWFAEDMQKWGEHKERFIHGLCFPSRLVDLGTGAERQECLSPGDHASIRLRLVNPLEGEPCRLPNGEPWITYAALSHRWGESTKASVTTLANVAARLKGFDFSELCQTFKDAIIVAREMGIRYIWIDSICIIQDSEDDWKNESQIMGDIYLHAIVTFAAHSFGKKSSQDNSSNTDGGTGFLDRAIAAEGDPPVLLGHLDEAQGPAYVYAQRRRMFEVDISNSQLSSRGWILQERLLSPRIVHFFDSQLYYESRYFNIVRAEDRTPALFDPDKLREFVTKQENKEGSTPFEWFKIVQRFSACQLTQSSDKLIALAGLAKQFQRTSKQEYLAGMFADRAIKGLMWIATGESLIQRRGRAPSWSWASVDGHIKYPSILFDRPFKVVPEMMLHSTLRDSDQEPKHLPGTEASNVKALFVQGHLKAVTLGRYCQTETAELIRCTPVENNLLPELDRKGTYREIETLSGVVIGWASLDVDEDIEIPARRVFAAVVASEECWVMKKDPSDSLWYTFPPSPEFKAFYATGKVQEVYGRIFEMGSEGVISSQEALELEPERELVKTFWVLLLKEDHSQKSAMVRYERVGFGQIFDRRWMQPDEVGLIMLV